MNKHGNVVKLAAWRSGRRGRAKLVALGAGLEGAGGQPLKFELAKRRHGPAGFPLAHVALPNAQGTSNGDLSTEVADDLVVGHGSHYGAPHMGMRINSYYGGATISNMGTIGARIREARKGLGLNQTELAKMIGLDQSTVSDIENGASFGADVLMSLSSALTKSPQFIMTGRETPFDLSEHEAQVVAALRAIQPKAKKGAA